MYNIKFLCTLFIPLTTLSTIPVRAQISLQDVDQNKISFLPNNEQLQRDRELRNQIVQNPEFLASFILPKVHPFDREGLNLEEYISDIVSWSPSFFGCGISGDIIGYYSPLDHLWVFVQLDENDKIKDAAMTIGFQASNDQSTSWLALVEGAGGSLKALQAATVIQLGTFATFFNGENCGSLADKKHLSHSSAVEQMKMLNEDVPRPNASRAKAFLNDLEKETKSDLKQWSMRYRLVIDNEWYVFFTSPKTPGLLLIAHWRLKPEESNAYFQNATLLPLLKKSGSK